MRIVNITFFCAHHAERNTNRITVSMHVSEWDLGTEYRKTPNKDQQEMLKTTRQAPQNNRRNMARKALKDRLMVPSSTQCFRC